MPIETVNAKLKDGEPVAVGFDIDENLDGAKSRYGEDVVYSRYRSALVIDLQSYVRSLIKAGKNQEEIQAAVDEWHPGIKARGKSLAEKAKEIFAKLTPEEREALLSGDDIS